MHGPDLSLLARHMSVTDRAVRPCDAAGRAAKGALVVNVARYAYTPGSGEVEVRYTVEGPGQSFRYERDGGCNRVSFVFSGHGAHPSADLVK